MARKNESSQKTAMREMMRGYLNDNDIRIKDGTEVNVVMHDMMSALLDLTQPHENMRLSGRLLQND